MRRADIILLLFCVSTFGKIIRKRQLFREQLLPHMGGKIPETAFNTDRLALNQLNARGIYSTSGVYLEHHSDKNQQGDHATKTMQVRVPEEHRYVAPEGRYHYRHPPTLDTTYVIREPVHVPIMSNLNYQPQPHLPYDSLKLARYFKDIRGRQGGVHRGGGHRNDIEDIDDFEAQAKNEYEPYLKKLHELDK